MKVPNDLDGRETDAWAALQAWPHREGLLVQLVKREADLADGRRAMVFEPEICWARARAFSRRTSRSARSSPTSWSHDMDTR